MSVDRSRFPEKFWHCLVHYQKPKDEYTTIRISNDLTIKKLLRDVVEPWQQGRQFNVGGLIVKNRDHLDEIRIVGTPHSQQYYAEQNKGKNVVNRQEIPFWPGIGIDYTSELLFKESPATTAAPPKSSPAKAFIVHGHDTAILNEVALLLERLDIEAVILKEQPNLGRTIIEKLEQNSDVGYAIILFTPDDEGRKKGEEDLKPRARQNAVLELGYFIGLLGRENVCALMAKGLDMPSDFDGVVYTPIDPSGAWHTKLAQEMRAAGLAVDLNKLS